MSDAESFISSGSDWITSMWMVLLPVMMSMQKGSYSMVRWCVLAGRCGTLVLFRYQERIGAL